MVISPLQSQSRQEGNCEKVTACTVHPFFSRCRTRFAPINPPAPVTSTECCFAKGINERKNLYTNQWFYSALLQDYAAVSIEAPIVLLPLKDTDAEFHLLRLPESSASTDCPSAPKLSQQAQAQKFDFHY